MAERYEYCVVNAKITLFSACQDPEVLDELNRLGAEGWEFVSSVCGAEFGCWALEEWSGSITT